MFEWVSFSFFFRYKRLKALSLAPLNDDTRGLKRLDMCTRMISQGLKSQMSIGSYNEVRDSSVSHLSAQCHKSISRFQVLKLACGTYTYTWTSVSFKPKRVHPMLIKPFASRESSLYFAVDLSYGVSSDFPALVHLCRSSWAIFFFTEILPLNAEFFFFLLGASTP